MTAYIFVYHAVGNGCDTARRAGPSASGETSFLILQLFNIPVPYTDTINNVEICVQLSLTDVALRTAKRGHVVDSILISFSFCNRGIVTISYSSLSVTF